MGLAAILLAVVRAVPAAERVADQLYQLIAAWRQERNLKDETGKNLRNACLVDAARGLPFCPECGQAIADKSGGQHADALASPPV